MTPLQLCAFLSIFGIIAFAVLVGLAVVLRNLMLWFWRINEIVDILQASLNELVKIRRNDTSDAPKESPWWAEDPVQPFEKTP